jgi:hypothetical protein
MFIQKCEVFSKVKEGDILKRKPPKRVLKAYIMFEGPAKGRDFASGFFN